MTNQLCKKSRRNYGEEKTEFTLKGMTNEQTIPIQQAIKMPLNDVGFRKAAHLKCGPIRYRNSFQNIPDNNWNMNDLGAGTFYQLEFDTQLPPVRDKTAVDI
ncbi:hypothetical protein LOAG_02723 [Loa loa]|uniref:Uncharacterized protein n=1 Tax=Loa loa TaxID=7209 RepID=A0A1S0U801_LOALO|nr:hypothetical protein LOAG_02723 [Loa loa]EFO25762.1 hypothetical protein LOAG_02723 [Loa loa]